MKKKTFRKASRNFLAMLLCLSIFVGVISMTGCNNQSNTTDTDVDTENDSKENETVEVLRVIDDINLGGRFTNAKVGTVTVRADAVPEGAVTDIAELKTKYAAVPLYAGDYITPAKCVDKKPDNAEDDENDADYSEYGYVVITDYKAQNPREDYSAIINRAIAENPGRTIYFPDGTYNISSPIVIPADPEKSVSLRLSNLAVIYAVSWEDPNLAMIRIGVEDDAEDEAKELPLPKMDEAGISEQRSTYVIGGCIYGNSKASGISIEGGKDTLIYNVSIKSAAVYGIHVHYASNELGATYATVDNVNITGTNSADSVGVLVEGTHNTFSNMRIAYIKHGVRCTETGKDNIFRNLHPLSGTAHGNSTVGFYDMSDGNNYDVCYSDQFSTGFVMYENTRSVYNGSFCYWYSAANGYHVGFRSVGAFNSIWVAGKVAQNHVIDTDAYMFVCEDEEGTVENLLWTSDEEAPENAGQGVVIYPISSNKSDKYKYILEYYCRTVKL